MAKVISFLLNGETVEVYADPGEMLVDVLRDKLHLTGTKVGCKAGDCGACTIIMDGQAVNSCMVPLGKAQGANILTIEGVAAKDDALHPVQQAFIDEGAVQCGYCIPGMVMSAKALLDQNNDPTHDEIREAMSGNICRCTGYVKIEAAIKSAAKVMKANPSTGCGCGSSKGGA